MDNPAILTYIEHIILCAGRLINIPEFHPWQMYNRASLADEGVALLGVPASDVHIAK